MQFDFAVVSLWGGYCGNNYGWEPLLFDGSSSVTQSYCFINVIKELRDSICHSWL